MKVTAGTLAIILLATNASAGPILKPAIPFSNSTAPCSNSTVLNVESPSKAIEDLLKAAPDFIRERIAKLPEAEQRKILETGVLPIGLVKRGAFSNSTVEAAKKFATGLEGLVKVAPSFFKEAFAKFPIEEMKQMFKTGNIPANFTRRAIEKAPYSNSTGEVDLPVSTLEKYIKSAPRIVREKWEALTPEERSKTIETGNIPEGIFPESMLAEPPYSNKTAAMLKMPLEARSSNSTGNKLPLVEDIIAHSPPIVRENFAKLSAEEQRKIIESGKIPKSVMPDDVLKGLLDKRAESDDLMKAVQKKLSDKLAKLPMATVNKISKLPPAELKKIIETGNIPAGLTRRALDVRADERSMSCKETYIRTAMRNGANDEQVKFLRGVPDTKFEKLEKVTTKYKLAVQQLWAKFIPKMHGMKVSKDQLTHLRPPPTDNAPSNGARPTEKDTFIRWATHKGVSQEKIDALKDMKDQEFEDLNKLSTKGRMIKEGEMMGAEDSQLEFFRRGVPQSVWNELDSLKKQRERAKQMLKDKKVPDNL
ncbi:hypothetical protein H072_8638 [Dactylellina haptotyla CBS 200.50]|uniref:Uncharacterized protein n=1 Tax=Dactylellina haptotyla (strain CBS 200.50) TaxID=1284197 RepID=S8A934_DACHA|nr:hypothetical protein H072_8638 [Dactylellina haptotyla CBS 200.50]